MVVSWLVDRLEPARLTPAEARAVAELSLLTWPKAGQTVEQYAADLLHRQAAGQYARERQLWWVVREGERFLAKAGTFAREIGTSRGRMTILALAGVCTRAEARGRGLGSAVVRAAFSRVDTGELAFSLFQTSRKNQPFYERLGAVLVENRIVNSLADNPQANPFWDEIAMRYPAQGDWPTGPIDLLGPGY
jgi:GNAT superfamily N-acetyltransferase